MNKIADYNLQSLKAFLVVAGAGSMTAAAARLGLTQSAVSQTIRQLEDALGTVLIDRTHRPLALTRAGKVLQAHAQPLIEELEALTVIVRQAGSAKIPELRIGVVDSFATPAGPELIRALLKTTTTLSFRSGLAHDQGEGLMNRSLDVIITGDPMDDVDGLSRYSILSEPYLLVLPQQIASAEGEPDLKRLALNYPFIRFSARSQVGAQIERHLRRLGVTAPRLLEVDATDALVAMVAAGLGWAIATPLCMLQVRPRLAGITLSPFPAPGLTRQLHLITRSGDYGELPRKVASLACNVLREHCLPEMKKLMPWVVDQIVIG